MDIKEDDSGLFIELNDSEVAMFAKIGINHAIKEGTNMIRVGGTKYAAEFGKLGETWDDDDDRIGIIGQNGNDGIHYPPHDDYIMNNPTKEEKEKNLKLYNKRLEDDVYI